MAAFVSPFLGKRWSLPSSSSLSSSCSHRQAIHITSNLYASASSSSSSRRLPLPSRYTNSNNSKLGSINQAAGEKGPFSADFLSVSGTLATIIAVSLLILLFTLPVLIPVSQLPTLMQTIAKALQNHRRLILISVSFMNGIMLSRFDLNNGLRKMKLIVSFTLILRILTIPILSYLVTILISNIITINTSIISTFFILSTTPCFLSPSLLCLATHTHPTLLALLLSIHHIIFPIIPSISYILHTQLNRFTLLPIIITQPPGLYTLLLTTTLPFFSGLLVNAIIKPRRTAMLALLSLPITWIATFLLLFTDAASLFLNISTVTVLSSLGLCVGVCGGMFLLARVLANVLLLKGRARRTIILFVCTPGITVTGGLVAASGVNGGAAVVIVAAGVAVVATTLMARAWSHVVIRTSNDVI